MLSFILTGASEFAKYHHLKTAQADKKGSLLHSYNSAYLISPERSISRPYHKNILLPFGEYLPMTPGFDWPQWIISPFVETVAGTENLLYRLPGGTLISPIICWENLFSTYVRQNVQQGATLIVHITNDNRFGTTAAAEQHNLASIMRAVENRVPVILASNTGPSVVIDAFGRVIASTEENFAPALISAAVQPNGDLSWYSRHGDLFAWGCILIVCAGVVMLSAEQFGQALCHSLTRQYSKKD